MLALFHIVSAKDWQSAQASGFYRPASLDQEGFIHFSYAHQWRLTQQRYYQQQQDLLLLRLDPDRLEGELRVESGFPHLYGPLPCSALVEAIQLAPALDLTVALLAALNPAPQLLMEAAQTGARLVVLPELPFNRWCPALPQVDPQDENNGRDNAQSELARGADLWLLGGILEERRNLACLWDPRGQLRLRYQKVHLPQEPGFWEANHYDPGTDPPRVFDGLGFPLGVQICSDIQRPFGTMFLRAQGAAAILVPRATERRTYPGWKLVMQAMARMSACYVLSVNRPGPELGVPLGGPSLVVGPDGVVVMESDQPLSTFTLSHQAVVQARADYPGYLSVPSEIYASAWQSV